MVRSHTGIVSLSSGKVLLATESVSLGAPQVFSSGVGTLRWGRRRAPGSEIS